MTIAEINALTKENANILAILLNRLDIHGTPDNPAKDPKSTCMEVGITDANAVLAIKKIIENNDVAKYNALLTQAASTNAKMDSDKAVDDLKRASKKNAKSRLNSINWSNVTNFASLKSIVRDIHDSLK